MQNIQSYLMALAENGIAKVHNEMIKNFITETLLRKGNVSIDEAETFNMLSRKIISESSDLFIPNAQDLSESLSLQESVKVLVDPDTGDKYVYYPDTGELVPGSEEDIEGLENADADQDMAAAEDDEAAADQDMADAEDDEADAEDDEAAAEDDEAAAEDDEAAAAITDADQDVSASTGAIRESAELNENQLLVKQLLSTMEMV